MNDSHKSRNNTISEDRIEYPAEVLKENMAHLTNIMYRMSDKGEVACTAHCETFCGSEGCNDLFKTTKMRRTNSMESTENISDASSEDETISFVRASDKCEARITESMESSIGSRKGEETVTDGDAENILQIRLVSSKSDVNPSYRSGIRRKDEDEKRINSMPIKSVEFQAEGIAEITNEYVYQQGIEKLKRIGERRENSKRSVEPKSFQQLYALSKAKTASSSRSKKSVEPKSFQQLYALSKAKKALSSRSKKSDEPERLERLYGLSKDEQASSSRSKKSVDPKMLKQIYAPSKAKRVLSSRSKKSDEPERFQRLFELSKAKQAAGKKRREDIINTRERAKERSVRSKIKISAAKAIRISTRMYDQAMKQRIALEKKIEASLTAY